MKRLMNVMMLSCNKATTLIEKKAGDGLSWHENMQLKMHTAMCDACSQYQKQSILLNQAIKNYLNDFSPQRTKRIQHLENHTRQRIQSEVKRIIEKNDSNL